MVVAEPVEGGGGDEPITNPNRDVAASSSVLSFLPGGNENSNQGGNALNGSLFHLIEPGTEIDIDLPTVFGYGGDDIVTVPLGPVIDNWLTTDMVDSLPETLSEARIREDNKYDEVSGAYPNYRTENQVGVSFDTRADNTIIEDSIDVRFTGTSTDSVLEGEDVNSLSEFVEGPSKPGGYRPRYWNREMIQVDGVDAVRVSTVFGGFLQYGRDVAELIAERGSFNFAGDIYDWDLSIPKEAYQVSNVTALIRAIELFAVSPNIFNFLELTVLADGRRFVRLLDASPTPQHVLYVDGVQEGTSAFSYSEQELFNFRVAAFFVEANSRLVTPYYAPKSQYLESVRDGGILGQVKEQFAKTVGNLLITGDNFIPYEDIALPSPLIGKGFEGPNGAEIPTDSLPAEVPDPFVYKQSEE
ncbi:hypothetical protein [Halococcus salifodinae]|uniref:Uncharacterized protein n=1 Tax=Halococcus salifodinae DSM 8989 TaxID=1227456 RepID=M0ND09_9EURY|nr:hypothetical protein [Halococcus salifodinae]EMA54545.1 hypothetical protein C450_05800 [Halococcus salifodinae DSM 8989]